jgi:hypothetical protein
MNAGTAHGNKADFDYISAAGGIARLGDALHERAAHAV